MEGKVDIEADVLAHQERHRRRHSHDYTPERWLHPNGKVTRDHQLQALRHALGLRTGVRGENHWSHPTVGVALSEPVKRYTWPVQLLNRGTAG